MTREIFTLTLTARQWESPCHGCKSPLFYGEPAFMVRGSGLVFCSPTCAGRHAVALDKLDSQQPATTTAAS